MNPGQDIILAPPNGSSPVRPYRTIIQDSGDPGYINRLMVATPVTGLVRIEWVQARYGQTIHATASANFEYVTNSVANSIVV